MYHVALYNETLREVVGVEEYATLPEARHRWEMFECESRARGGDWHPYIGEKPFEFTPEVTNEKDPV